MDKQQLEAIRARDADYNDVFEAQASMSKDIAHRLVAWPVADRRALLAHVDALASENAALRSRLAAYEVIRTQLTERGDNYQQECAELRSRLAEAESDRDAAFRAHDKAHAACIHYDEMLTDAWGLLGEAREALRGWSRDDGTTEGDCPCSMCNNTRLINRIDAHLSRKEGESHE